jgi:hypothetical protein
VFCVVEKDEILHQKAPAAHSLPPPPPTSAAVIKETRAQARIRSQPTDTPTQRK